MSDFQTDIKDVYIYIYIHIDRLFFMRNGSQAIATLILWWLVNVITDNGLVQSDNKPLPEPMFTQLYVAVWRL